MKEEAGTRSELLSSPVLLSQAREVLKLRGFPALMAGGLVSLCTAKRKAVLSMYFTGILGDGYSV